MIKFIAINGRPTLMQMSGIHELLPALLPGSERKLLQIEKEALMSWLLRYARMLRPGERIDCSADADASEYVSIGKADNGRPYVFDGRDFWPDQKSA